MTPFWAKRALQGIAFWIAHRRCFYRQHPLTEGALVAEICNLINANLRDRDLTLDCEVQVSKFLSQKPKIKKTEVGTTRRCDCADGSSRASPSIRLATLDDPDVRDSRAHNYPPRWSGARRRSLVVIP